MLQNLLGYTTLGNNDNKNDALYENVNKTSDNLFFFQDDDEEYEEKQHERTCLETFSWGFFTGVIIAVTSRTISELVEAEKPWEKAAVDIVAVVFAIEWFKQMFNFSGGFKKEAEQTFNQSSVAISFLILTGIATILLLDHADKQFSSLGFDAVFVFSGMGIRLLLNYAEARIAKQEREQLPTHIQLHENQRAGKWYNSLALFVGIELFLLYSATNAGGQYLEAIGIPLAETIEAQGKGITNVIAATIFAVFLNAEIGYSVLKLSGKFEKEMPIVNLASRIVPQVTLTTTFQLLNLTTGNLKNDFNIGFAIAYVTFVAVEISPIGRKINEGASYLLSGAQWWCCAWKSDSREDEDADTKRLNRYALLG